MAFSLVAPASAEEAVRLLADPDHQPSVALAGGTDLLFDLGGARPGPARVVSLRRLPWNAVRWEGSALAIGSTAPLTALETDARVRPEIPGLWMAVRAVGGVPLRHRATVGGNLGRASAASDLIPVLLALDASADLFGPNGRRAVPVTELIRGPRSTSLHPAELIEAVRIPEARPSAYLWQRVRPANDISQVGVAAAWSPSRRRWSLAAGGVGPVPLRLTDVERSLHSDRPNDAEMRTAVEVAMHHPGLPSDKRASEEYRRKILGVLVRRALERTVRERGAS